MVHSEFIEIIKNDKYEISISRKSHFSIATSPYYAHQHGLALDIYHQISIDNYPVISPVAGKIIKIKQLSAPKPKFHKGIAKEYLILIENNFDKEVLFKILHVKPKVKVGQSIKVGDPLGTTIRNGYFAYWSSPHIHLELRSPENPLRARGGQEFILALDKTLKTNKKYEEVSQNKEIPIKIRKIYPEFLLCHFPKSLYGKIKPIFGVIGTIYNKKCLIDGGIPQYQNGIVIFSEKINQLKDTSILLNTNYIGNIKTIRKNLAFFECKHTKFFLNKKEIRGISFFLANFFPYIKIIPYKINQFSFKLNSIQYLSVGLN
jgi:murein DD-endopeptidase MepM/ murein hydrolase activator NlpD